MGFSQGQSPQSGWVSRPFSWMGRGGFVSVGFSHVAGRGAQVEPGKRWTEERVFLVV